MKLLKKPSIYIYIYIAINTNPNSLIFQLTPPASSPLLRHFSSQLLRPHPRPSLPHIAHGLTPHVVTLRFTASHLMQSRSSHPPTWCLPHGLTLTHPHSLILTL